MNSSESVSVIITSHNYGRYLDDCIRSVKNQLRQANQILVVADACSDETVAVANKHNVPLEEVNYRNCYESRRHGLSMTQGTYVIFLDADDMLGDDYIDAALKSMRDNPRVGIVTSGLRMFGDRGGALRHQPCNIEARNWLHAGSMVRRAALESSGAYDQPTCSLDAHEDWYVWRPVIRAGWLAVTTGCDNYLYRQHAASMMAGTIRHGDYYTRASLKHERITLVVPVCRERYWSRLSAWILNQSLNISELLLINSADDKDFGYKIDEWVCNNTKYYSAITHIRRPYSRGLADLNRAFVPDAMTAVQKTMPKIYEHLRRVQTEYMCIVEDDVLPPVDAFNKMLKLMDHDVAGVTAVVPSRYQRAFMIGGKEIGKQETLEQQEGVDTLGYSGFGCLLLRKSAMLQVPPFNTQLTGNYDVEFWREVCKLNWRLLVDYSIRCKHAELEC